MPVVRPENCAGGPATGKATPIATSGHDRADAASLGPVTFNTLRPLRTLREAAASSSHGNAGPLVRPASDAAESARSRLSILAGVYLRRCLALAGLVGNMPAAEASSTLPVAPGGGRIEQHCGLRIADCGLRRNGGDEVTPTGGLYNPHCPIQYVKRPARGESLSIRNPQSAIRNRIVRNRRAA